MRVLLDSIEELKNTDISKKVDNRIEEFKKLGTKNSKEIFKELCFCILTANFNAERGISIQQAIDEGFLNYSEKRLQKELKKLGHRFPNTRAKFISEAQKHKNNLKKILNKPEQEVREWIAENVKGLGYKEASHFLRNIGFQNLAIIDFHIIDLLVKHGLIEEPKTLTKKKYLEIENLLKKIAEKSGLTLAELDLYLWFAETGKILK